MVFLQSEFLNVPSNLLHQQRQSCTGCICRIFPQSEFSNVSLNCFVDLMQSHIGCICTIFPQNEISYDSSNCLPSQMQSHRCCIRMTNPLFGWPFWCPISKGKKSELKVKVLCLWIPLFKSEIIQLSLSWIINVNVDKFCFFYPAKLKISLSQHRQLCICIISIERSHITLLGRLAWEQGDGRRWR